MATCPHSRMAAERWSETAGRLHPPDRFAPIRFPARLSTWKVGSRGRPRWRWTGRVRVAGQTTPDDDPNTDPTPDDQWSVPPPPPVRWRPVQGAGRPAA